MRNFISMDIQEEVIKFLQANQPIAREGIVIEGIDQSDVEDVLKHLAMTGRLNQDHGSVRIAG